MTQGPFNLKTKQLEYWFVLIDRFVLIISFSRTDLKNTDEFVLDYLN